MFLRVFGIRLASLVIGFMVRHLKIALFVFCLHNLFMINTAWGDTITKETFWQSTLTHVLELNSETQTIGASNTCPAYPAYALAQQLGYIKNTRCPKKDRSVHHRYVYHQLVKVFKSTPEGQTIFRSTIRQYNGPDLHGIKKPYGLGKNVFKFYHALELIPEEIHNHDIHSNRFSKLKITSQTVHNLLEELFYRPNNSDTDDNSNQSLWQPQPGTTWYWQLQGEVFADYEAQVYDIDLFDSSKQTIQDLKNNNIKVICYMSAGSYENWRPDESDFPDHLKGKSNGWAGEKWLDIRDLETLRLIMSARFDLAVEKGCDAIEPDNIDGYTNTTGFDLSYADQLAYNTMLAHEAHQRGLSIGLKNDLDQIVDLVDIFDFAINEQCHQYNECDLLLPFIEKGKAVFGVEYEILPNQFCEEATQNNFSFAHATYDLDGEFNSCLSAP